MTVELVHHQVFWYNFMIPEDYISDRMSPGTIVTGRIYDYNMLCGPETMFDEYVQTHEQTDNTMNESTVSAIILRPSGTIQGNYYYYSLVTGKRLHRRKYTPLPMPQDAIDRVRQIGDT